MMDFKAKLVSVKELTHDVRMYMFERPAGFSFKPGQFVMLQVEEVARAYSIASSPLELENFVLIVKLIEGGRGSEYLRAAKAQDEISFKGPFGHFYLDEDSERDVVLIGTGTGLAPLYSILQYLLESGSEREIKLFFGVRHEEDVFLREEFEDLSQKHENFSFKIILSRPKSGEKGYVTDLIKEENIENSEAYICGGKAMVDDVKEFFTQKGISPEHIKHEVY